MATRSTQDVVSDHLALAQAGELETDIARNYAPDCVLMTSYGRFEGHEGIREAARLLREQLGETRYDYRRRECHGELGFLEWAAASERGRVEDGADSYWVHEGRIRAMTAHYTVQPPGK